MYKRDKFGETVLINVVSTGNLKHVKEVLRQKPGYLNIGESSFGHTPLDIAVQKSYWEIAGYLLKMGANPNKKDVRGRTVLHWAAGSKGGWKFIKTSAKFGAKVNVRDMYGATPLIWAATSGLELEEEVCVLLDLGAIVGIKDRRGYSALEYAALFCKEQLLDIFLRVACVSRKSWLKQLASAKDWKRIVRSKGGKVHSPSI